MEEVIRALFEGPISSRLPAWAITIAFVVIIMKYTGVLEWSARTLNTLFVFIKAKERFESDRERWQAEKAAELESIRVTAAIAARTDKQEAEERSQQQLYSLLERSFIFIHTDIKEQLAALTKSHNDLRQDILELKAIIHQDGSSGQN